MYKTKKKVHNINIKLKCYKNGVIFMKEEQKEKILEELNKYVQKPIVIKQTGFILSEFFINSLIYEIKLDTLTLRDEKENIYISINLNQVYKEETSKNSIQMFLDNDTEICIQI